MNLKFGFLASVAALTAAAFTSCEDKLASTNCDAFRVDYVDNVDSIDTKLAELSSGATVIIHGSGLSTATGVFLVDGKENEYAVDLNPTFKTDEALIVTLNSEADIIRTEKLLIKSAGGCDLYVDLAKPVPAPSIKQFRSEFVPDGGTLRIAGNAFLSVGGDELEVYFFDKDDNKIKAEYTVKNDNKELYVTVPEGVADSKPVYIKNQFGECTSSMLFRDRRNVWLDFDNVIASDLHGILDTFSIDKFNPALPEAAMPKFEAMKAAMGGKFPEGCDGYYAAISTPTTYAFTTEELIYFTPYSQGMDEKSLKGEFAGEDLSNLVLKFEVCVPKEVPLAQWFYMVFSAYGSEDALCKKTYKIPNHCGFFSRDLTNLDNWDEESMSCDGKADGTPGGWLNMANLSVDESAGSLTGIKEAFHTDGEWLTVAVPLTNDNFKFNISKYNMVTDPRFVSCAKLSDREMYNFLLHAECGGKQAEETPDFGGRFFVAFDNFRIVPEDKGGVRFTKYYGATAASKYPF